MEKKTVWEESVGEAFGLSTKRDEEISKLAAETVHDVYKHHRGRVEIITELQKTGLKENELLLAVFYGSAFMIEAKNKLKEIRIISGLSGLILLDELISSDEKCGCDECFKSGNCPKEESARKAYKEYEERRKQKKQQQQERKEEKVEKEKKSKTAS
ncbi:MAG: hypothetical protein NTU58_03990 [Candidatus Nealsonbacteria bacterium]|nr:hypothetical protein [Candidatus Nealsonbacteria bacterium]